MCAEARACAMCFSASGCQSTAQCSSCCTRPRARDSVRARVRVCISPLAARDRVAGILRARLGAFPLRSHRCVVPLLRGVEPWSLARPKQVSARRHLARLQSPAARRARRDRDGRSSRNTSCCCPPRGSALPGRGGQDAPSQARDPGRLARGQGKVRWTEAAPRRLRRTVAARAAPATPQSFAIVSHVLSSLSIEREFRLLKGIAEGAYNTKHAEAARLYYTTILLHYHSCSQ